MGPLIPLALALAPELATLLFGPQGNTVEAAVAQAVQAATGTGDAASAQQAMARDPQMATQLRGNLAQLAAKHAQLARQADLDALASRLRAAPDAGAAVPWAPLIVSVVVLLTFAVVLGAALTRVMPAGSETMMTMLLGTLAAMATSVVGYWVGSSAGSAYKTDLLFRDRPSPAQPQTGAKP